MKTSRFIPLLCLLTLLAYFVALRWVAPGYFAPLAPFHADFYDYAGMAGVHWMQILQYPRPLTFFLFKCVGLPGLRFSMAAGIAVALADVVLILWYAQRLYVGKRAITWAAASAYLLLLFMHPEFYLEHRHDMPATFSLLFALAALHCLLSWVERSSALYALPAVLSVAAMGLTKETFFLSLFALALPLVFMFPAKRWHVGGFLVFCAAAEALSMWYSRSLASPFVDPAAAAASTYYIDTSIGSVVHVFGIYGGALFLWPVAAAIVVATTYSFRIPRNGWLNLAFVAAGLLALLPISLLPNHIFPEYAWLAAPFALMPLATVRMPESWPRFPRLATGIALGVILLIPCVKIARAEFRTAPMRWYLEQERIGRNVLAALDDRRTIAPGANRILIAGLDTPFSPWNSDSYVGAKFGRERLWFVVVPQVENAKNSPNVQFWTAPQADLTRIDEALLFDTSGKLKQKLAGAELRDKLRSPVDLVPELSAARLKQPVELATAPELISAGERFAYWSLFEQAKPYFERAVAMTGGKDPEALFQLGRADLLSGNEMEGKRLADTAVKNAGASPAAAKYKSERDRIEAHLLLLKTQHAEIRIDPPIATAADPNGLVVVKLAWSAPEGNAVELHVGNCDGPLLASATGNGSAQTGRWVRDKLTFYLQDVSAGKSLTPGNTLATATAQVLPGH